MIIRHGFQSIWIFFILCLFFSSFYTMPAYGLNLAVSNAVDSDLIETKVETALVEPNLVNPVKSQDIFDFLILVDRAIPGFFQTGNLDSAIGALSLQSQLVQVLKERHPEALEHKRSHLEFVYQNDGAEGSKQPDIKTSLEVQRIQGLLDVLDSSFSSDQLGLQSPDPSGVSSASASSSALVGASVAPDRDFFTLETLQNKSVQELQDNILKLQVKLQGVSSNNLAIGLIKVLPLELQSTVYPLTIEEKIDYLATHLKEDLREKGFQGHLFGIQSLNRSTALARLKEIRGYELKVQILALILESKRPGYLMTQNKWLQKLVHMKQFVSTWKAKMTSFVFSPPGWENLTIREAPINLSILRGFPGGDCSTARSFAFPYSPYDKVFLISGKHGIKGYVDGTLLKTIHGTTFYLHTIAGPQISRQETLQIIEMFAHLGNEMGFNALALPTREKMEGLVNYQTIREGFEVALPTSHPIPLQYQDENLRKIFGSATFADITATFDLPSENTMGHIYSPRFANIKKMIRVGLANIRMDKSESIENFDRLVFLIQNPIHKNDREDLDIGGHLKVLELMQSQYAHVESDLKVVLNLGALSVDEYIKSIEALIAPNGFDFWSFIERYKGRLLTGLLNCPDIFNVENKKVFLRAISLYSRRDLKLILSSTHLSILSDLILIPPSWYPLEDLKKIKIPGQILQKQFLFVPTKQIDGARVLAWVDRLMENDDSNLEKTLIHSFLHALEYGFSLSKESKEIASFNESVIRAFLKNKILSIQEYKLIFDKFPRLLSESKDFMQSFENFLKQNSDPLTARTVNTIFFRPETIGSFKKNPTFYNYVHKHISDPTVAIGLLSHLATASLPSAFFKSPELGEMLAEIMPEFKDNFHMFVVKQKFPSILENPQLRVFFQPHPPTYLMEKAKCSQVFAGK